ncbi:MULTISPECIES: abortive infection family protein [Pseudomonas]|jgi:hypothetical protein|uniref:abortive infection family protein n=1 Tax=Pseudomonas TaxID=286 RepID=UPI00087715A1|nr:MULTISPECIES: abortive infection family protein [Pseudomonas]TFA85844.1 abortive infection Abi-like protein [Pseudomonas sp. LAIL14HWK12:I2]SCZ37648.1 Abortive infection C-terminus [Pseudomonas sp. NFIX46]SDB45198.1 Abortive infection C-terminus [Pseudomonas putida]SFQ92171.1 Abortive infection C-terminus [Pseudomonas sp. NFIX49]
MASGDGFAALKALSRRVKNQRSMLLHRLKAFENKLLESSEGVGCFGSSTYETLSTWDHEESGISGGVVGWLFFDGGKLWVRTEAYSDSGHESECKDHELDDVEPRWLVLLSTSKILNSLIENISRILEDEHILTASANEWLTEFVAVEKALIDKDLEEQFETHPTMLESWQKAQQSVEIDPEDSIARSSSHVETVLKACLKQLGDTGHEAMTVQALTARTVKKLNKMGMLDEGAKQALIGIATIFHGVGTLRNSSSTAHGKNDGYTPPGLDLAQLINHLAGACSVFVLKQTEKVVKGGHKSE